MVIWAGGIADDGTADSRYAQQLSSGDFFNYNPRIFREGYDCFIDSRFQDAGKNCGLSWVKPPTYAADRGAIPDLNGNLIASANPARINQFLVAWVSGLGSHGERTVPAIGYIANIPLYGYAADDRTEQIPLQYAGESSFPGLFQINFMVPGSIALGYGGTSFPDWPCGNYAWEVSLAIGIANYNGTANLVQIPVIIKNGDVPCK